MAEKIHHQKPQASRLLKLKRYKGYLFPEGPLAKDDNLREASNYTPQDGDLILCSYPKTGTTWMTYIIWMILHKPDTLPDMRELSRTKAPYLEQHGIDRIEALQSPRFYRTHLPRGLIKINDKAKYICTYRRPEDTLVSYYHFGKVPLTDESDFDEFVDSFLEGIVPCGSYFDHLSKYYDTHKDDSNFLFVSYEDLIRDSKRQILRIAKFLDDEYYEELESDERLLMKILRMTSFEHMKTNLSIPISLVGGSAGGEDFKHRTTDIFRKGEVGEGERRLTSGQLMKLRDVMIRKMGGTEFVKIWSK